MLTVIVGVHGWWLVLVVCSLCFCGLLMWVLTVSLWGAHFWDDVLILGTVSLWGAHSCRCVDLVLRALTPGDDVLIHCTVSCLGCSLLVMMC